MNENTTTPNEEGLREELRQAREQVDRLSADLYAVDSELEELESDRERYRILQNVCSSLEELRSLGGAELFWGDAEKQRSGESQLGEALDRADDFEKQLSEIESRRQLVLDSISAQENEADFIAGYVLEAERLEEEKLLEWEIERDGGIEQIRESIMAWSRGGEDDRRFRKCLALSLLFTLIIGALFPLIDLPIPDRWEVIEVPDRLTQLVKEEMPPPKPAPVKERAPENEALPDTVEEAAPILADQPIPESAPAATKSDTPKAASKGILAFREKFSGLAETDAVARLGSNARIQNPGELATSMPQRAMVTSQSAGSSGGINVAELSRSTGGGGNQLGGVAVARATSSIGTGSGSDRPLSGGGPGLGRTDEEIQIVFDRHKSALYRLYNRELRKNPTLRGQMVLRMTIEPDGSVSMCEVKSTDLDSPKLSERVLSRVRTFDFGAKEGIQAITIVYPIDFLPAT